MEYGGGGRGDGGDFTPANMGEHLDNAADHVQNVAEAVVRVAGGVAEAANATSAAIAAFESVPFGAILSVARVILATAVTMHTNRRRAEEMRDAVDALLPFVHEFKHECEVQWSGIVRDPNKVLRIRSVVDYLSKQLMNAQACLQKNCNRNAVVRFFLASSIREEFRESMEKIERGALFLSLGLSAVTARNVETLLKGAPIEPLVVAAVDAPSDGDTGAARARPSSVRAVSMRRLTSMAEAAREDEQRLLHAQVDALASADALLERVSALAEQAASGLYEGIRVFGGVLAAAVAVQPERMRTVMAALEPPAVRTVLEALVELQKQKQQKAASAVAALGSLSEGELRVIAQLTDLDAVLRARRIAQANAQIRGGGAGGAARGRAGSAAVAVDAGDVELSLPLDDDLVIDEDVEWAALADAPRRRSPFTIHTATWKGMSVLAKRFASARWTRDMEQVLRREVGNLRALLNPHIIKLYGIARPGGERESPALIYEPMDTTLECVLAQPAAFPLRRADRLRIVEGIARGLHYVHSQGLLHHDIEPRHVYVNVARDHRIEAVKLAGFGLARVAGAATAGESVMHMETSLYMAPEVFLRQESYRAPADVFAFALLAHYVLSGSAPYAGHSSVVGAELRAGTRPAPLTAAQAPSGMNELLAQCWAESPARRPTVAALWDELVVVLGAEIDGLSSPDSAAASPSADVFSAASAATGSDPQARAEPPPPVPMSPTRRLVEVLHAYRSDELGHVALEQGDVVEVLSEVNSDWCCVTVGQTVGIVPRAYLAL